MATTVGVDMRPWQAMLDRVKQYTRRNIGVGVFGDAELATIAAVHEYGAPAAGIPERSYLRSTMQEQRTQIRSRLARVAKAVLTKGMSVDQAFGLVGEFVASAVKRKIRSNIPPPLAPTTLARKGGKSIALILTGRLLNSITWRRVK